MYTPFLEYTSFVEDDDVAAFGFEPDVEGWAGARARLTDLGFALSQETAERVPLLAEPYVGPEHRLFISPTVVATAAPTLETVLRRAGFNPREWRTGVHYKHDTHGDAAPGLAGDDALTFMVAYSKHPLPFNTDADDE